MSNRSLTTAQITADAAQKLLAVFQGLVAVEVVINGEPWEGGHYMFTFIGITPDEFRRFKSKRIVRQLRAERIILNFGAPAQV